MKCLVFLGKKSFYIKWISILPVVWSIRHKGRKQWQDSKQPLAWTLQTSATFILGSSETKLSDFLLHFPFQGIILNRIQILWCNTCLRTSGIWGNLNRKFVKACSLCWLWHPPVYNSSILTSIPRRLHENLLRHLCNYKFLMSVSLSKVSTYLTVTLTEIIANKQGKYTFPIPGAKPHTFICRFCIWKIVRLISG